MVKEPFFPGTQVVHNKVQVIGLVVKLVDDFVHVKIAENMPIKEWKKNELSLWDPRAEIQKRLKKGGYIRDVFKKMEE